MKSPVWIAYTGILALLSGTLVASHLAPNRILEPLRLPLDTISKELAGWKMVATDELSPRQLRILAPTSYLARTYGKSGQQLGLLIAHHDSHQSGVSVHTQKNCLPADGWEIWKSGYVSTVFNGNPVVINQYNISKPGHRMVVLYWYQSRNRVIANEYFAKFMLVRDALAEGRTSGSFVRIAMPDHPDVVSEGLPFAGAVMNQLQLCFRP
jgi:EpsI family protein